ncbi:hypothetical protein AMTR_s00092p00064570 [Amborella trichopoda]|uniref:Ubiquitin-like domain-containing protein n=1 Tax=Amborella trichopoda TaxID=13333 RepID=W1NV55_AMBTC|nr:hypothetical protein AMTR_s00092p00064570 [Amborella trichopoda]
MRRLSFSRSGSKNGEMNEGSKEGKIEWEMRPGGMLVQKRCEVPDGSLAPTVRLRVAYGAFRYDISADPQSTFGELKKLLSSETGLQPGEMSISFRGKERENGDYLDNCGVKDRSKVVVIEDPTSRERKFFEMRKKEKIQSAHRAISDISIEIDKLSEQISSIEKSIANGKSVLEVQIATLIELLMRQVVKLERIPTEGEATSHKTIQVHNLMILGLEIQVTHTRSRPTI